MNGTEEIGCCGAYCGTCREYRKTCRGCKPGDLDGSRNLNRARCKMKKCCLARGCITCGDCAAYESCGTVQSFLSHPGYKYGKYRQALEYIRAHGHAAFLKMARHWTGACGRFPEEAP